MRRSITLAAAALLFSGCTWNVDMRSDESTQASEAETPTDSFFVQASLFYPERVALPGDAEVLVAVDAVREDGRTPLTRFTTRLGGQQVPIPLGFSVETQRAEPAVYELSAAVLAGENLLRLTGPVLLQPEGGRFEAGEIHLHAPLEIGFGQAWQCGEETVLFGAVDQRVVLALGKRLVPLSPQPAETGVRYRARHAPGIGVDEEGGALLLRSGDERRTACQRIPPLEPPLTGGGNEPGWRVAVGTERIELTSDYGQTVTSAERIATGASGLTTRFRALGEHGPMLVAFRKRVCNDSATGMPHPFGVDIQFEGGRLQGCGGAPRDLLTGTTWSVRALDGEPLPETAEADDALEVTLNFDPSGRVSGQAGCNRYSADYQLSGEGLAIGPVAATKRACPGTRSDVEQRFLQRLASVRRFQIGASGELVLIGTVGRIGAEGQGL